MDFRIFEKYRICHHSFCFGEDVIDMSSRSNIKGDDLLGKHHS